jgi:enoyl-CoA hydratase
MFDHLQLARDGAVAVATINRPEVLNALDRATLGELRRLIADLKQDTGIRAVVITGAGDKAFVAGADIGELATLDAASAREHARLGQDVLRSIEALGKPVIAALNGFALGGGCELAMACTLRIAVDSARLGQPEINLGLIPGFGGTQRLPRLISRGLALELMLTGRQVSADEALRLGLVNRVVRAAQLMTEALTLAHDLAGKPPLAMRYIIEAVHRGSDEAFEDAQALEATLFGLVAATADMREGTRAFLEKRKPVFTGE